MHCPLAACWTALTLVLLPWSTSSAGGESVGSLPQSATLACANGSASGDWDSPVDGTASPNPSAFSAVFGVLKTHSGAPLWILTAELDLDGAPWAPLADSGTLDGRLVSLQGNSSQNSLSPAAKVLVVRGSWLQKTKGQGLFAAQLLEANPDGSESVVGQLEGVFEDLPYAGVGAFQANWVLCN